MGRAEIKQERLLKNLFFDIELSPVSFSNAYALYKAAKRRIPEIKLKTVRLFLEKQEVYQLHKQTRRVFPRNRVIASGIGTHYQADLCDMQNLAKYNNKYKYILFVVDVFSKKAFGAKLLTKKATEVGQAFQRILDRHKVNPWWLYVDKGTIS
jgi:hypothetical protein